MKSILMMAAIVVCFELLRLLFGTGVMLTVAMSALSFCLGVLWGAGKPDAEQ